MDGHSEYTRIKAFQMYVILSTKRGDEIEMI